MNPQHAALTDALTRAANYIDALGGDSKPYRAALAASPAAPAPCATEPDDQGGADAGSGISDEQIAALRDKHGITSSGRGIRAFDQIRNFVHAVLAMAPATTQPHPSSAPDPSTQQRALAHRCRTRGPGSRNPAEGEEL